MREYLNILGNLSYPMRRLKPISWAIKSRLLLFSIVLDASIPKKPGCDHFSMSGCSIFANKTRFMTARSSSATNKGCPRRPEKSRGKIQPSQLMPVEKKSAITSKIQTILSSVIPYCNNSSIKCYNLRSRIEIFS